MEKAKKYRDRAARSKELDKNELDYAKSVLSSGNLATRLLTGGAIGSKAYQQHVAMNDSRDNQSKAISALLTYVGRRPVSMIRKALYLRQDEKKQKQEERVKKYNAR